MNLIILHPEDFIDSDRRVRLSGRRLEHILKIHRAAEGDELRVGIIGGAVGSGKIVRMDRSALEMEVHADTAPPPKLPISLLLALPRPKIMRRILRTACGMGVSRIVLLNCSRVEKSYWQSPFLTQELIREQLILGLEQAKDTIVPEVLLRPLFKPFVEDELPSLIMGTRALVAHPGASTSCPLDPSRDTTLAIGPEGGFIPYEIEKLISCGFTPISFGERTLSVETAVPALIARLSC